MALKLPFAPFLDISPTDLDPLIVASPTPRCGTTLLQRLLCSSSHALIYGEKCAQDLELFLNVYMAKAQEYSYIREGCQQKLQNVLRGEVNDWIQELLPDVDGYLLALQKSAFAGISYCRDYAVQVGRPAWGFKYPGWLPTTMRLMRACMPGSRFIFIFRDILPCLKSAKAQRLVITEQDVRGFCQKWVQGVGYVQSLNSDKTVLVIHYEELVDRPDETLRKIASFSGLQDIDKAVLDHKINIWMGQQFSTQSNDGYIPPLDLTEDELAIIDEIMVPFREANPQVFTL